MTDIKNDTLNEFCLVSRNNRNSHINTIDALVYLKKREKQDLKLPEIFLVYNFWKNYLEKILAMI